MGLETATFITGLTPTWPTSGELKSQGDDHLRLIKQTLQNTFPTAGKAFYFPKVTASTATVNLVAADQNTVVALDTTAGNVTVNLPSTLGAGDNGWSCEVLKSSPGDSNAALVFPASGTIRSKSGDTASVRVGIVCEPARFIWIGSSWYVSKPGPMIGSTENFDGVTVPPGYLIPNGSSFSNTAFAELFAVLGSSVLTDKRGRVEAGVDATTVNLSSFYWGGTPNRGSTSGADHITQDSTQMPIHYHTASMYDPGHVHGVSGGPYATSALGGALLGAGSYGQGTPTISSATTGVRITSNNGLDNTYTAGGGAGMMNIQPTIIVQKMVRAC